MTFSLQHGLSLFGKRRALRDMFATSIETDVLHAFCSIISV